ncbi:MAG TPA: hypothetical protein VE991_12375, partial [Acidimicrobiales bacterium]|nr:hypothetical protein [Acidimicrobiales bacterium]
VNGTARRTPAPARGGRAAAAAEEPPPPDDDEGALLDPEVLASETEPAGAGLSPEQRLKQLFPGAEEV